MVTALALIVPASALGQAAGNEYDQNNLPEAGGGQYSLPGGGGNAGNGPTATATGDSTDSGGGATGLLIALAVVAAGCVGVAAWRLRRSGAGIERGGDAPPPPIAQGTTGESRTL